ncbi:DNA-binding MarR family transcriptional regulator [Rhizobium tibeticum]|uniref:MarR family transcriptional regulator n=1 Tax=Rhizobium tibeticum TaxID=501024 RepID=UPI002783C3CE|nr:MarR family transcriptional regulator [Rhizobium tibeticum]MDP9807800.1 DNA-binding MarR family transcriptional regulator [Rhizobium tibeticum]
MTIGMLADRLLIAPHSARALVNRLEEMQLLARTATKADSRRQYLALTPAAERILEQLSGAHLHEIREWLLS